MAIFEPYEYRGDAVEITMTGKELSEMINKNPESEFIVFFDFKSKKYPTNNVRRRVIIYESDA